MKFRQSLAFVALAALVPEGRSFSQAAAEFEAASVKPNASGDRRQSQRTEGRTFRAINVPARTLIRQAYRLMFEDYRLLGAPSWTSTDRFDVVATIPEGTPSGQSAAMLQALLADRFKLKVHTEVREAPGYALVLARKDKKLGPQLHRAAIDCGAPHPDDPQHPCEQQINSEIKGRGQRIDVLAKTLLQFVGRSVVDRTGLTGGFDFDIRAAEIAGGGGDAGDIPSIFTAIQEQLGLKLKPIRVEVEFVVVDRIHHPEAN
jgi:uncharacterized protein (TIGR03435 family)